MTEFPPPPELPKVTVAIPTLNRVEYLRLALECALGQTYGNIEVIVSNNASTDETASYLACCTDPRLKVVTQSTVVKMVENWNSCVSAASGEYFLLLSDDDLLEPEAIEELVAGFSVPNDGQNAPGFVYCGGHIIDSDGGLGRVFKHSPQRETARELIPAFFLGERDLWLCAILFRTADVHPGFSAEYAWAPDSRLWIYTVIEYHYAVFIARELVRYRVHQNATSSLSLRVWKDEITRLGRFAIEQYLVVVGTDRIFASRVKSAVGKLIVRTVPGKINKSFGSRKLTALHEYGRQLPDFLSLYGMQFLMRGLASLFISEQNKTWLLNILRKGPAPIK
jgi:glycosyltransferase involved in cell wall biosynthesis